MENKKLTKKQELFIHHYIANAGNATQAAISAGYSEKTAYSIGEENLRKPEIKAEIERLQAETIKDIKITKERLLNDLNDILLANKDNPRGGFVALKAIEIVNKMLGYNEPDKSVVDMTNTIKWNETRTYDQNNLLED